MIEVWKDAVGHEGRLQISNTGKVRQAKTKKIYKTQLMKYEQFSPYVNGKKSCILIHRLVGETFISNPENKPQLNHIDGNKHNNHVSNLEWVTGKENVRHAFRMGLSKSNQKSGERNSNSKLTEDNVRSIRALMNDDPSLSSYSIKKLLKLDVCPATIYSVMIYNTWKEIK